MNTIIHTSGKLVGGALTILKDMSSSMGRMTSHISWKIKLMFETTNQSLVSIYVSLHVWVLL